PLDQREVGAHRRGENIVAVRLEINRPVSDRVGPQGQVRIEMVMVEVGLRPWHHRAGGSQQTSAFFPGTTWPICSRVIGASETKMSASTIRFSRSRSAGGSIWE